MSSKSFEIAIVGGGIAGLTLAIALHRRNIAVQVYEQTAQFKEIGAGVSFSPNTIAAMETCDGELDSSFGPGVKSAFDKVTTTNGWPSKQTVWFDYYDGMVPEQRDEILFSITSSCGQQGVHRARFLDELVKAFPVEKTHLGKRLQNLVEREDGKIVLTFTDGTSAEADAVVGCDGIHSRVRSFIVGENHPSAHPSYSHKYAYRGIVPMEKAIEAIGEEKARNSCMFLGKSGHVLTFPMDDGKFLNMVAFYKDENEWTDDRKLTRMSTREDALDDFRDFGPDVTKIMNLVQPQLPVWAIFDTCENPLPIFFKGRVAVIGDAAHATSPHHGNGAGFAIEDSALVAELLADELVRSPRDIEVALATYDEVRRGRDQWLVESSRFVGNADAGLVPEIGTDYNKLHQEIKERYSKIIEFSPKEETFHAKKLMHEKLALKKVIGQ